MPRPLRIQYEHAFYHVMNRGRGQQPIFHGPAYCHSFLTTLEEAHRRFATIVHAYSLMGNHYHLLLETPRVNLDRIMRHINGVYTQRYNRLQSPQTASWPVTGKRSAKGRYGLLSAIW
ncbi:MAG: hypothetical protein GKS05_12035 [Nitrospirales bacterium]|nr:hypothetical protein [Nitrospirales bacterium]